MLKKWNRRFKKIIHIIIRSLWKIISNILIKNFFFRRRNKIVKFWKWKNGKIILIINVMFIILINLVKNKIMLYSNYKMVLRIMNKNI